MSILTTHALSQVRPEPVRWLWPSFLPRGKLALLDGDPGVGKSLLTIDIAARLSRGGPLPDGTSVERPHVSLLLGAEDDAADTIRPRAEAAGADLDRIITVASRAGAPLAFPAQLPELEECIRSHAVDLVVIDPIMAFLPPEVAANADQCVRCALTPLAALAARTDCAILLVRHLRKAGTTRALYRGQGSIGIIAAARTALLAAHHPTDPTRGLLTTIKTNVVSEVSALGYRIASPEPGRVRIEWTGPESFTADALMQSPEAPLRMRDRAASWLRAELANGPRQASDVYAAATAAGIPERTLERAKGELRVRSHLAKVNGKREWFWYDPDANWPKNAPFKKPFELPPLEEL